jgi:hypothetical protein
MYYNKEQGAVRIIRVATAMVCLNLNVTFTVQDNDIYRYRWGLLWSWSSTIYYSQFIQQILCIMKIAMPILFGMWAQKSVSS